MSHLQSKRDDQGRAAAAWEGVLLVEDRRAEHPPPTSPPPWTGGREAQDRAPGRADPVRSAEVDRAPRRCPPKDRHFEKVKKERLRN